jgi:hypothetical protein
MSRTGKKLFGYSIHHGSRETDRSPKDVLVVAE